MGKKSGFTIEDYDLFARPISDDLWLAGITEIPQLKQVHGGTEEEAISRARIRFEDWANTTEDWPQPFRYQTPIFPLSNSEKPVTLFDQDGFEYGKRVRLIGPTNGDSGPEKCQICLLSAEPLHYHLKSEQIYVVLDGDGYVFLGLDIYRVTFKDQIPIKPGQLHAFKSTGYRKPLLLERISTAPVTEEDTYSDRRGRRRKWFRQELVKPKPIR